MEENPYKAPVTVGAATESTPPKSLVTLHGCALAIITGFAIGLGLLYLIGLIRSLTRSDL